MATETTMISEDEWNTAALMIPHYDAYSLSSVKSEGRLSIRLRNGVWITPPDEPGGPVRILYVHTGEKVVFSGTDPIAALAEAYQYILDNQIG